MAYNHNSIEPKWQARWRAAGLHRATFDPNRPKFYVLDMFPYPSGSGLHVGHCEPYAATDVVARWKRMQGWNVLHPFGWDAFGLPAENYAIKTGIHPRITTTQAVANFRRQLDSIGFAYDWEREINTTDPRYVRWTQWIFLQLFKVGLAYEAVVPINWCPSCKTGLANEEVLQGRCERCETPVERKDMRQWMLRITQYADRLLDDLIGLDWPESTLTMQRNWIGRSDGAEVVFRVVSEAGQPTGDKITVFTTRPDTLFGATYLVLAPEHALVEKLTTPGRREMIGAYVSAARHKSDLERTDLAKEKTGIFTGGHEAASCWYLRYLDGYNDARPWSSESERQWMPVDLYVGGAEHAVLHLLYARFWHKVLFDLGYVSTKEPFKKLRHQGIILGYAYRDAQGRYHEFDEVGRRGATVYLKSTGEKLDVSSEKMSKSKLNGVNPDDVVALHGADALRLYEMFMGDFEQAKPWDPRAIEGMSRFLRRVLRLVEKFASGDVPADDPHLRVRHRAIKKVTGDLEAMKFNTAIAALMEFANEIVKPGATREDIITLIKLIAPFAPHLADEAWEKIGGQGFVIQAEWPQYSAAFTSDTVVTLAVQVNGKLRGTLRSARGLPEANIGAQALALPSVAKHVANRKIKNILLVPDKVVSIVTE